MLNLEMRDHSKLEAEGLTERYNVLVKWIVTISIESITHLQS
jgi:hypothetical protein